MWYTVQSGDSLFSIAQRFGVSPRQLSVQNQIEGDEITPDQRIFIPIQISKVITYTVQSGDSLYSIARQYNTLIESIVQLNRLQGTALDAGQRLVIPQYTEAVVNVSRSNIRSGPGTNYSTVQSVASGAKLPVVGMSGDWLKVSLHDGNDGWISRGLVTYRTYDGSKPISDILGFYTLQEGPALPSSFRSFVDNTSSLTSVPLFLYRFDQDDPSSIEKFGEFTDNDIETLVSIAHRNNIMMLPVVHNLLYESGGQEASRTVVQTMLATQESRGRAINNIIALIDRFGFDGVNIDIEDVFQDDSDRLSQFFTELGNAIHAQGYYLSASVPSRIRDFPPFNPFSDPFDYSIIGAAVDEFVVMLYNEHGWPGSGPGPVVSSGWMNKVIGYTLTKMPANKVVAAISVFGFDFNLATGGTTYVTYEMAANLAEQYGANIIFDQDTLTPMFSYTDDQGNSHEVWFENKESIIAKIRLAWQQGINGVALWRLGLEDPNLWPAVRNDIVVRRITY